MKKRLLTILAGASLIFAAGCGNSQVSDDKAVQQGQSLAAETESQDENEEQSRIDAFCEKYGLILSAEGYRYQKGNRTVNDTEMVENTELIETTERAVKLLEEDCVVSVSEAASYLSGEEQQLVEKFETEGAETGVQILVSDINPDEYDFYAVYTEGDKRITVGKQTIGTDSSISFSGGADFQGSITDTFLVTDSEGRDWLCMEVDRAAYHFLSFEHDGMTELQIEFRGYTREEAEKML